MGGSFAGDDVFVADIEFCVCADAAETGELVAENVLLSDEVEVEEEVVGAHD